MAGVMRTELGGYLEAFVIAGVTGLVAAGLNDAQIGRLLDEGRIQIGCRLLGNPRPSAS